ncbi:MAG: flagellar biosynthesis protein FlhB [Desulfobacterales bacterium]|nr:flagellar biosynthesis protein FlhB [Desulfobacterales bacterium]
MPGGDFQDKTEKATPRKRREAREKGQVAKSREVASVAVLLAGLSALYLFGSYIYSHIRSLMQESFSMLSSPTLGITDFLALNHYMVHRFIAIVIPVMIVVFVIAILSNFMQVGVILSWEPIMPKFSKVSPVKGMSRLFSKQSLMELFKSLAKLAVVGATAYWTVKGEMDDLLILGDMGVPAIALYILKVIFKMFILVSIVLIFLAALDYAFQKWQFEQQLKMTKQEVKEEFKRTEGDPLVKSRIRRLQQEVARRRMMQEVPKADVVVTNPVRLALALRYDSAAMTAPQVVAKGAGEVAKRIRELAEEHHIPIVEKKELAQNLYKLVELGAEVPSLFYQAVAEVLAYVYRLKGKAA